MPRLRRSGSLILATLIATAAIAPALAQDRGEAQIQGDAQVEAQVDRPARAGRMPRVAADGSVMRRDEGWSGPARVRAPTGEAPMPRPDRPRREERARVEVPTQPMVQPQPQFGGQVSEGETGRRRRDDRDGLSGLNRVMQRGNPALREQRRAERGGFGGERAERDGFGRNRADRQAQGDILAPRRGDDRLIERRRDDRRGEIRRMDDRRVDVGRGSGQGYGGGYGQTFGGYVQGYRQTDRRFDTRVGGWSRDWRQDRRYDWQRYRYANRDRFVVGRYRAPFGGGYGYRRFTVGIALSRVLFDQRYWIDDPYDYRLPEVYGAYRWVRYYDDVLLVDLRTGQVVDAVYDFFD